MIWSSEKGKNHFEVLPEGWLQVTHNSGLPIYMHKASRVCSVSRPYFLGPASLRVSGTNIYLIDISVVIFNKISECLFLFEQKHQIPVSAIPCLSYRRALEDEKKLKESVEKDMIEVTNNSETQKTVDDLNLASECPLANGEKSNGTDEVPTILSDSNKISDDKPPPAKKPRMFGAYSNAKIETVKENLKEQSLTVQQINEYCKNLFVFKNIRVMRFT